MPRPLPLLLAALALVVSAHPAAAQLGVPVSTNPTARTPATYELLGMRVEGVAEEGTRQFVMQTSGLREGQRLRIPGDEAIADAVRRLYELGSFSDVAVVAERFEGDGVHLLIRVTEVPRVGAVAFEGLRRSWEDELRRQIPLLRGRALRTPDLERSEQVIQEYLASRGFRLARVDVLERPTADGRVDVTFAVDRGPRVEIGEVRFVGNEAIPDGRLRGRLSNTRERRWWRFWSRDTFDPEKFAQDKERLLRYYQDRGFYSARVVRDSVWTDTSGDRPQVVVEVEVDEGPLYHVRHVIFDGNTVYTDEQLRAALGVQRGDVYNRTRIERNLYYSRDHTDVFSLYQDRGYLRFNVRERVIEVPGDSLDLVFEVEEGEIYRFGQINIRGNTRTKDHVIRRQLRTIPGAVYSRQAIERSIRELAQLNYFDPESLQQGPRMTVNEEDRTVDLTFNLVETGGDQLELSGGWGGAGFGLILQARVTFNNFSAQNLFRGEAWRPVPSGDGQQLSIAVQASGLQYQNYSLSFTEPYFRGRNRPVGFALSYTFRDLNRSRAFFGAAPPEGANTFRSLAGRVFYRQQLSWPDDFFQIGTDLNYRLYDVAGRDFSEAFRLPEGLSQEVTVRQTLSRNSFDNPIFPTVGSSFALSSELAVPIGGFNQYHKQQLNMTWVTPLVGRLSLQFAGNFGYIGSLTGEPVRFQRYVLGGSPLDVMGGFQGIGLDPIFMRGYPYASIGARPPNPAEPAGGTILNKYSLEARLFAFQSAQFSFAPYVFADAANTWNGFGDYNPTQLYRSAGVGVRLFLPILGMLDFNYGYAFDPVTVRGTPEPPQWRFQFSIGQ